MKRGFFDKFNAGKYCADPYKRHKLRINKDLRNLNNDLISKHPNFKLTIDHKVCSNCKILLRTTSPEPKRSELSTSTSPEKSDVESNTDIKELNKEYEMSELNAIMPIINESPFKKCRASVNPQYSKSKFMKLKTGVKRKIKVVTGQAVSSSENEDAEPEILQQLKEKFNKETSRSEKLRILSVLPKSWSRQKIMKEFQCTQYIARQAKILVQEKGVLSTPNPRIKNCLPKETIEKVIEFYHSSDISREMPGMKDYVSVKGVDGHREKKQKHLILCNLKEAYRYFKE